MKSFSFCVTLAVAVDEDLTVRLFEAGCDDAIVGSLRDVPAVHFCRKAESLGVALQAGCDLLRSMNVEIDQVILEPRDLAGLPGRSSSRSLRA